MTDLSPDIMRRHFRTRSRFSVVFDLMFSRDTKFRKVTTPPIPGRRATRANGGHEGRPLSEYSRRAQDHPSPLISDGDFSPSMLFDVPGC